MLLRHVARQRSHHEQKHDRGALNRNGRRQEHPQRETHRGSERAGCNRHVTDSERGRERERNSCARRARQRRLQARTTRVPAQRSWMPR